MSYTPPRSLLALATLALAAAVAAVGPPASAAPRHSTAPPTVQGVVAVGHTVACRPARTAGVTGYRYRWLRDAHRIAGQTSHTYKLGRADAHTRLSCAVTPLAAHGVAMAAASSDPVPVTSTPTNVAAPTLTSLGTGLPPGPQPRPSLASS